MQVMADLIVHLLQTTAVGLQVQPAGAAEAATARQPLPPPMYASNEVSVLDLRSARLSCSQALHMRLFCEQPHSPWQQALHQ